MMDRKDFIQKVEQGEVWYNDGKGRERKVLSATWNTVVYASPTQLVFGKRSVVPTMRFMRWAKQQGRMLRPSAVKDHLPFMYDLSVNERGNISCVIPIKENEDINFEITRKDAERMLRVFKRKEVLH